MILTAQDFSTQNCTCGKNHKTSIRKIIIKAGCLVFLRNELAELELLGAVCAVYDTNTYKAVRSALYADATDTQNATTTKNQHSYDSEVILPADGLHADEHAVALLVSKLPDDTAVLVAVGAGTIHDIVRYVAAQKNIPFVSVPTAASVDGFVSSVAAMTWKGFKQTMSARAPVLVLADLRLITKAPMRLSRAGVGDILGKHTCLADWKIAHELTGEYYCTHIAGMMQRAIESVEKLVQKLQDGSDKAYESLIYALLLSGVAMQLAGNSRPASGAEHHISHFMELGLLPKSNNLTCHCQNPQDALHGEKVGAATVYCAALYHRLAKKNDFLKNLPPYQFPPHDELQTVFGSLTDSIIEENNNTCAKMLTPQLLTEKNETIRRIIQNIPQSSAIEKTLKSCGAVYSLSDLGIENEQLPFLARWTPFVRNRLTFMRIQSVFRMQPNENNL